MSKRQIISCLKRKGLEAAICEYEQHVSHGEMVGAWTVELTEESEERLLDAGVAVEDLEPDCFTAAEVLEWVAALPDSNAAAIRAMKQEAGE